MKKEPSAPPSAAAWVMDSPHVDRHGERMIMMAGGHYPLPLAEKIMRELAEKLGFEVNRKQ